MLFAVLIGILGVLRFACNGLFVKLKFLLSGGKRVDTNKDELPLVIFSDDKRYWPVFEPIVRELDSRAFDVAYLTASPDDPALAANYPHLHAEFIGSGNKPYARLNFLKATLVLSTTPGLDVYQWKRSKDVKWYVHIPHMPGELTTYRMFGTDHYDALLLSGQYQIDDCRALEKLRGLPEKECVIVGIPYLDEKAKRLETTAAAPHGRTVLVAPSWGGNSLLNRFGNKLIDPLIATGYQIIIRPHPQSFSSEKELIDRLMKDYPELEWNRDTDNFDVLNRSDILISDFSGVIFDFSLVFNRPVICAYTDFDASQYDAWWLDTPIWTATAVPRIGPILREDNLSEIKEMIDAALEDQSYAESRREVIGETWANRGRAAVLAADYLIAKYHALTAEPETAEDTAASHAASDPQAASGSAPEVSVGAAPSEAAEQEENVPSPLSGVTAAVETGALPAPNRSAKKRTCSVWALVGIAVALVLAFFLARNAMLRQVEKQNERADLELMRAALAMSALQVKMAGIEERAEFWIDGSSLALLPCEQERPRGYGLGTARVGGTKKDYSDNQAIFDGYDEAIDYSGKVIKVTIDPQSEQIGIEWVDGS